MGNVKSIKNCQRRKKELAVERFGGKCCICGYKKCVGSLVFHHLEDKKENPSYIVARWSWERAKKELDKCILVCANCHGEIHYNNEIDTRLLKYYKPFLKKKCIVCHKKFETKKYEQKFCSHECSGFSQRVAKRPSKKDLKFLLEQETSWVKLGRMFGVSDNAVRKWARKYGLL